MNRPIVVLDDGDRVEKIDTIVDFLIKENSLRIGESPWPEVDPEDSGRNIDWQRLYPGMEPGRDGAEWDLYGDDWEPEFDSDFVDEIVQAATTRPPSSQSRPVDEHARWDVCAWYQPIHYFGHAWGIFIREECARRLAVGIANFLTTQSANSWNGARLAKALLRAAIYAYFLHEQYHHKVECLGLRLHVVDRTSRYLPYHTMVYRKAAGSDDQLEEALANAHIVSRLSERPYHQWISAPIVKATRQYLRWSFPYNPPGYRRAVDYLKPADFHDGENLLHGQVKEATLKPAQPTSDWEVAPRLIQSFFPVTSDIWTVLPRGTHSVLPTVQPVRTCSTIEMIKLYEKAGYKQSSGGKGSHVKLAKPNAPTMILPGDRDAISPGVAKTALRVLGDYRLGDLRKLIAGHLPVGGGPG